MKVDELNSICRSCMSENSEMVSVFDCDESEKSTYNHADMLMAFTSVQILSGDGLPEQVCLDCVSQIKQCYLFKLKCENSDNRLRERISVEPSQECSTTNAGDVLVKIEEDEMKPEFLSDLSNDFYHSYDEPTEEQDVSNKNRIRKKSSDNQKSKIGVKVGLKCEICHKKFRYERNWTKHMNRKHSSKSHTRFEKYSNNVLKSRNVSKCKETSQGNEGREMKKVEKVHKCDKCKCRFAEELQLNNHIIKRHFCTICSKKFTHLDVHLRSHTGEKDFLCSICGRRFNQRSNYDQHMLRHSGIRSFVCEFCQMSFITKGNLASHLLTHSDEKNFQCDICSSTFNRSDTLHRHREIAHFGKKKWECDVCTKTFSQSHSLVKHKLIHTGEKPHKCNFCEKKFTQKTTLTAHLRTHTGDKPYICNVCGQAFGQRSTLRSHKEKESHL